jgi:ankyrin repeat protein
MTFPLKNAAIKGSVAFIRLMLENKVVDINKLDSNGLNCFWIACICGHGEVMRVLAERGIDIMNMDQDYNNVLHCAATHKQLLPILKMLVQSNFPRDEVNIDGDTAVHIAA